MIGIAASICSPYIAAMDGFAERRRLSFGSVAAQYDRSRPRYPRELLEDVLSYLGRPDRPRVLDVGAGTGIATVQFAPYAASITAVEPDAEMAAVISDLSVAVDGGTPIDVIVAPFADGVVAPAQFDLLISATAWHWVDHETRYRSAARVLAPGGVLAAFWNRPRWDRCDIRPGLDRAYAEVDDAFEHGDQMRPGDTVEMEAEAEWHEQLDEMPEFGDLQVRSHSWSRTYATNEYIELIGTHSSHILLAPESKARLFDGVAKVIDANGGSFELVYDALLCLARRV